MNIYDRSSDSMSAWQEFKRRNPGSKLTKKQFVEIIHTHNTLLVDHLIETGEYYKIPCGFGPLRIKKYKQHFVQYAKTKEKKVGLAVNWPETKKLWERDPEAKEQKKLVKYLNAHTDGYRYFFYWQPHKIRVYRGYLWGFRPSREAARKLAKKLKEPGSIYKDLYQENDLKI